MWKRLSWLDRKKNKGNKKLGEVDGQQGKRNARIKKKKLVTCIAGVIKGMFEIKKER